MPNSIFKFNKYSYKIETDLSRVATGDFNADGKPDVASINTPIFGPYEITISFGDGQGSFKPGPRINAELSSNYLPNYFFAADFNGDSNVDLGVIDMFGIFSVLFGDGKGNFIPAMKYNLDVYGFNSLNSVQDLNGDNKFDQGERILLNTVYQW